MAFETEHQKREIQRWSRLAIQLVGAADSGRFDHITTSVVASALNEERLFDLLDRELPTSVWDICKLTDVDKHELSSQWHVLAHAYEPAQFHVTRSGLALLATCLLHLIDIGHATITV